MSNTHGIPDTLVEVSSRDFDLLPHAIVSTTWPGPPGSGLTIPAFATRGYVRSGQTLTYVDQPARAVTLPASDGTYHLALTADTHSALGGYTRVPGAHYAYLQSPTPPAPIDGGLVFAAAVVSGGTVTSVTPVAALASLAAIWRLFLGLGTLAQQDAHAVAITGGSAVGLTLVTANSLQAPNSAGNGVIGLYSNLTVAGGTGRSFINHVGDAPSTLGGSLTVLAPVGVGGVPDAAFNLNLVRNKSASHGLRLSPTGSDTGGTYEVAVCNITGAVVGSITSTASATSFNTSSDVRLKHAIAALTGALDVVRALRPVAFRWQADDSPGVGFLAHELQQVVPEAVTGLPDEVHADGTIKPQQVDHSRLIPWLTACCQELAAQVQTLSTRLQTLEEQLGL